jgi:hypothetical protein
MDQHRKRRRVPGVIWRAQRHLLVIGALTIAVGCIFFAIPSSWNWARSTALLVFLLGALALNCEAFRVRARTIRRARGLNYQLCIQCGYPLVGLPSSGHCPECGEPYHQETLPWTWERWSFFPKTWRRK